MRQTELDFHRLHGDVDISGGWLAGFDLPDDIADSANGGTCALGSNRPLVDAALLSIVPADTECFAVVPGEGASFAAVDFDIEKTGYR